MNLTVGPHSHPRHVLLVACLENDKDGQMAGLAKLIASKKQHNGHVVREVNFCDLTQARPGNYDEISFVGHSEFYRRETGDRTDRPSIPLKDRTIGGIKLKEVSSVVIDGVFRHNVRFVKFYCCEAATNVDTAVRQDCGLNKATLPFNRVHALCVSNHIALGNDHKISTLAYLAADVHKSLEKAEAKGKSYTVRMQGIEGYGYYTADNWKTQSFESKYFKELAPIQAKEKDLQKIHDDLSRARSALVAGQLARRAGTLAKDISSDEKAFVHKRVKAKASAHKLQFVVSAKSVSRSAGHR